MQEELYALDSLWPQLHYSLESTQFASSLHEWQVVEYLVPSHGHHSQEYTSMIQMQ